MDGLLSSLANERNKLSSELTSSMDWLESFSDGNVAEEKEIAAMTTATKATKAKTNNIIMKTTQNDVAMVKPPSPTPSPPPVPPPPPLPPNATLSQRMVTAEPLKNVTGERAAARDSTTDI